MSDTRTPEEIEHDLEKNRADLRNTIQSVQDTFKPENLVRSVTEGFRENGGEWGRQIGETARQNPLALALTGIGLGWLLFGQGPSADRIGQEARNAGDRLHYPHTRDRAYGEGADAQMDARGPVPNTGGPNWLAEEDMGPTAGQRARAGLHNTTEGARQRIGAGRDAAGRAAGRVRDRSEAMGRQIREGTENLGHDARERVILARERAIEARESAGRSLGHAQDRAARGLNRGADRAGEVFDEHPLVVGALAFAVGAAIAGTMPRSRAEDDAFGAQSDALVSEAEAIFEEERAKAERVAGAAMDEARNVGRNLERDAEGVAKAARDEADNRTEDARPGDVVVDRIEAAAGRVAGAAGDKAEDEDLGNPRSGNS